MLSKFNVIRLGNDHRTLDIKLKLSRTRIKS